MEVLIEALGSGGIKLLVLVPVFIGVIALVMAARYLLSTREEVLDNKGCGIRKWF